MLCWAGQGREIQNTSVVPSCPNGAQILKKFGSKMSGLGQKKDHGPFRQRCRGLVFGRAAQIGPVWLNKECPRRCTACYKFDNNSNDMRVRPTVNRLAQPSPAAIPCHPGGCYLFVRRKYLAKIKIKSPSPAPAGRNHQHGGYSSPSPSSGILLFRRPPYPLSVGGLAWREDLSGRGSFRW